MKPNMDFIGTLQKCRFWYIQVGVLQGFGITGFRVLGLGFSVVLWFTYEDL